MFQVVFITLVGFAFGQVDIPHGHDLHLLADDVFRRFDHNPADGIVTQAEYNILVERDDTNNDSCVSMAEYKKAAPGMPDMIAETVFKYEAGTDSCITVTDRQNEFHKVDHNGDGVASLHEFEQYYAHLSQQLFGHGHNG